MTTLKKRLNRDVATPVTMVLFAVSTVTGLMLLLHWHANLVRFSHEWLSVAFSAVALWHLFKNGQAFVGYCRRHLAVAVSLGTILAALFFTGFTAVEGGISPGTVIRALTGSPLEAVAPVFKLSVPEAELLLAGAGFAPAPGDSLSAIGQRAGTGGMEVLSVLAGARRP